MNNNGPYNKLGPGMGYSPYMRNTSNRLAAPWNDPTQTRPTYGDRPGALMAYGRGMPQFQGGPPPVMPMQSPQIDPNRVNPQMPQGGAPQGWQNLPGPGMQQGYQISQQIDPGRIPSMGGQPPQNLGQWQPGMPTHQPSYSGPGRGLLSPPPVNPQATANQRLQRLGPDASLGQINRRLENPNINDAQRTRLQARANRMVTSGRGR